MNATGTPRLSLAPIPYFWSREAVMAFYEAARDWPVDVVYLGETVCPKRRRLRSTDYFAIGESLAAAGKEVVISTLTLIEAGSELGGLRSLCRDSPFTVEANDMAAVGVLERESRGFVAGPTLNLYNAAALERMRAAGARRWVLPVELGAQTAGALTSAVPALESEILAWGRLPLAWSARCFTARAENRSRDDCGFACGDDPDGRVVRTQDGQPFLTLNGIQTQSAMTQNLAADYPALCNAGVGVLRLVPQSHDMEQVVAGFDALRNGAAPEKVAEELAPLTGVGGCNGYWHGAAGLVEGAAES